MRDTAPKFYHQYYGHNYALEENIDFAQGLLSGQAHGMTFSSLQAGGVIVDQFGYYLNNDHILSTSSGQYMDPSLGNPFQDSLPAELPFLVPGVDTPVHKRMFCHFTSVMSHILTIDVGDSNPFNSVVIPLALGDKNVMDTLLCLAGSHLSRLKAEALDVSLDLERTRLHQGAVQSQSYRVQMLKDAVASQGLCSIQDQELIFATSILLFLYEICEGSETGEWKRHLDIGRQVLTLASTPEITAPAPDTLEKLTTEVNPFLLEFFVYHESVATVTSPSLGTTKVKFQGLAELSEERQSVIGIQDGLIDFVTRISTLRCQAELSTGKKPDGNIVCKAVQIWQDLTSWKPKTNSKERRLIAEVYRWALFIWLFSIVYPEGKADEKVQTAVQKVAAGMCEIKYGDGVMACLLFPLFIVGSAAIETQDRETISGLFTRLRSWSALGNIDSTYRVVEKMWQDHDEGVPSSWDWVKQLDAHGMSLLVT